ncbi:MAG TPA: Ig-like domain-containing protein, partial [Verrucomicrobiae bacterium]
AGNTGGHSIWYEWTAPFTSAVTMSGAGAGNFRILLAAYTGTAVNALTEIDSAIEPQFGGNAVLSFTAIAGTSYKIVVDGRNATSSTFSMTLNQPVPFPTVSMTAPVPGQSFTNPALITLSAAASSSGGAVTNVSFYYGGNTLIGIDTNSPYSIVWSNVPEGAYSLTTRATDVNGQTGTSSARTINVRPPGYFSVALINTNSIWKYLDNGTDQGVAWREPGFDDALWASGPGQLGYSSNALENDEATIVSFGPNPANKHITTYFRHTFMASNVASITNLFTRVLRDDGVAVYLNGVEVQRNNLIAGAGYLDLAGNAGDDGYTFFPTNVNPAILSNGVNVIAAEIHQTLPDSTDISFYLELFGEGAGSPPTVAISSPANNASLFGPVSVTIMATASDPDGTVTNVEFFVDGVKIGQTNNAPYNFVWSSPTVGPHVVSVTARDNAGASASAQSSIVIYDSAGTPLAYLTSPIPNASFSAPASISLAANAYASSGVGRVEFYANATEVAEDFVDPYSFNWNNVLAGSYALRAVTVSSGGARGTSSVVNITVTNTPPPTVVSQTPAPGNVAALTSVQVTFSKAVTGVDAADFLVNGAAATGISGSGSSYTFTFSQPSFGIVAITWAAGHGIVDLVGQPFNAAGAGATWNYNLTDPDPPQLASQIPPAGATVTNLTSIQVFFSENVQNVDAGDLRVNGNPATGLSGSGNNYTFSFGQPAYGTVTISWAVGHGITDISGNAFNGAASTWNYTLSGPTLLLVETNATYTYFKGQVAPSSPITLWRTNGFDDSSWLSGLAPFGYDDNPTPINYLPVGTLLSDMRNGYLSVFMRHLFPVSAAGVLTNVIIRHRIDDGLIVWLNGIEIFRTTATMGTAGSEVLYNVASGNATDQAGYTTQSLPSSVATLFRNGTNLLAIQAQNSALDSSDLIASVELTAALLDP